MVNELDAAREDREAVPPAAGTGRSEAQLVGRARGGDVQAFERLYRASVGRVHAVVLRMVGDAGLAEEVTQDVFVRAWRGLEGFEGRSRFDTWVHRMAVNRAIDALRARKRNVLERLEEGEEGKPFPSPAPGRVDLERAIAGLPPGARVVFVLHDVEGFQHEEIAAMTGIAAGTSKAQLHRARKLLRERLR